MSTLCIAFDVDDTLYLECDYVRSGLIAVGKWAAATLGINHFGEKAWELFERGSRGRLFQEALQMLGRSPEPVIVNRMVEIYRNHEPEISLLPDAIDCLRSLQHHAIISIITDGPLVSQRAKCRKLRLEEFCACIVCTDEWGVQFYKPHRRGFEFVKTQAGPGNFQFVYVGDNPLKDFGGPLSLGWDTVRVRRPRGLHFNKEALPGALPRIEIEDLSRMCTLLGLGPVNESL